jgi:hypothetical protein
VELGTAGELVVEGRSREFVVESGEPERVVPRVSSRWDVRLRTNGAPRYSLRALRALIVEENQETGSLVAFVVGTELDVTALVALDCGVAAAVATGDAPAVSVYEPRLPGEFGLGTLNASGTRWYIRGQAGLPGGACLSLRVAGGPGRERLELGIGLDIRGF